MTVHFSLWQHRKMPREIHSWSEQILRRDLHHLLPISQCWVGKNCKLQVAFCRDSQRRFFSHSGKMRSRQSWIETELRIQNVRQFVQILGLGASLHSDCHKRCYTKASPVQTPENTFKRNTVHAVSRRYSWQLQWRLWHRGRRMHWRTKSFAGWTDHVPQNLEEQESICG